MDKDKELFDLSCMLVALLDGTITSDQFSRLKEILRTDQDAREYYYDFVLVQTRLNARGGVSNSIAFDMTEDLSSFDYELWQSLAREEKTAAEVTIQKKIDQKSQSPERYMHKPAGDNRSVSKPLLYTAILSSAALIFILLFVKIQSLYESQVVATLVDSVNAEWVDTDGPIDNGTLLRNNKKTLFLKRGIAKLLFEYGAEVLIEAPAEFELKDADELSLLSGRLYTKVPSHAIGFSVNTPSSTLIDLGTEFGVKVDFDGTTDVHMIKGKASLVTGRKGQTSSSTIINSGHAKRVNTSGTTTDIELQEKTFVREISSQTGIIWKGQSLSLADIVGGGNGFGTGRLNSGIDIGTGKFVPDMSSTSGPTKSYPLDTSEYYLVPELGYVDGVFIPDSANSEITVTSQGHKLLDVPVTSGKYFQKGVVFGSLNEQKLILDGIEYGSVDKPVILMRRNKGITFDIDAIRKDLPNAEIVRFKAICGISEAVLQYISAFPDNANIKVTFYVLVDGQTRFIGKDMTPYSGGVPIIIELSENDRFLTLITAASALGGHNTYFFAKPELELE